MKTDLAHLKIRSGDFSIERQDFIERQDVKNVGLNERLVSMFLGGILISKGLKNPFKPKFLYGAYLTYRGFTGKCLFYEQLGIDGRKSHAVNIRGEFIIDRPRAEVYAYWRNLNNLPISIKHLLSIEIIDEYLSKWKSNALGPLFSIKWNAEIVKDEPGRLIGWRSLNRTLLHHVGKVEFSDTPDGSGTLLKVVLSYRPPIGGIGMGLARLLNPYFEQLLKKEIKNFKYKIEHPTPVLTS